MPSVSPKDSSGKKDAIAEKLVKQLIAARGFEHVEIAEDDINHVLDTVKPLLLAKPMLLEIKAPTYVLGDIHGQFHDLLSLFEIINLPSISNQMLFLGDYVDRGKYGLETIILLFSLKIVHPQKMHLLRGNHESKSVTRVYGFYEECKSRYNVELWKHCVEVFDCLPVAARINGVVLCMHGGLSPVLHNLNDITKLPRPTDVPQTGLMTDLLWADPDKNLTEGWADNPRKVSVVFAASTVTQFCNKHDLDVIIRAHQVVFHGYEIFADGKMITVFTAPNFCGQFENMGGIVHISKDLKLTMSFLDAKRKDKKVKSAKSGKKKVKDPEKPKDTKAKTCSQSVDVQQSEKTAEVKEKKKSSAEKEKMEPKTVVEQKAKEKCISGQTNSKVPESKTTTESGNKTGIVKDAEKQNEKKKKETTTQKKEKIEEEEEEIKEKVDERTVTSASTVLDTIYSMFSNKKP